MVGFYLTLIDEPSNRDKFKEIYNNYKNMMFRTAMNVTNNFTLAEDAVQESFFKIAKNISRIQYPVCNKTAAFIMIIVRNTSIDILKAEHIERNTEINDEIPDISMDVLNRIVSKEGYNFLVSIVKELDNIYSDVLMLRFVYDYDVSSIAEMLNIPGKTVETRIYRGKKILKEKLKEYDYE